MRTGREARIAERAAVNVLEQLAPTERTVFVRALAAAALAAIARQSEHTSNLLDVARPAPAANEALVVADRRQA